MIETRASYGLPSASSTCCCNCGDDRRERPAGSGSPSRSSCQRGGAGVADECLAARRCPPPRGAAPCAGAPGRRAPSCTTASIDGGEIEGNDEHRPPHPQQAGQRAPFVQRGVEIADREPGAAVAAATGTRSPDRWRAGRRGRRRRPRHRVPVRRGGGERATAAAARRRRSDVSCVPRPRRPFLVDSVAGAHSLRTSWSASAIVDERRRCAAASSTGMSPCTLCPASAKSLDADVREAPAQLGLVGVVDDGLRRASRERASRGR